MYATHIRSSIKVAVWRKRVLGSYNLHREGLESKLTLLPVFCSNCIEIIDNGSLIK